MDKFDFSTLEGFGPVLNQNIYDWFSMEENITFWKELLNIVKLENVESEKASVEFNTNNIFYEKKVIVTGKIGNLTQDEVYALLAKHGAKSVSSVTTKTDYVIVGEKPGSKLTKANELGIKIITAMDFLNMMGV